MKHGEKGFSLITLVVIIAISALIACGAGITTVQIIRVTDWNVGHSESVQQSHSLGRWFSRDAMASSNITAGDDAGTAEEEMATLIWNDWETGGYHHIRYIWLDEVDPLKKILRNEIQYDKEGDVTDSMENLVAYGIYTANLTLQGNTWILSVESRCGEKSSIQTYEINPRLN